MKQLLNQVQVLPDTECWEFRGTRDSYGYGRMPVDERMLGNHLPIWPERFSPRPVKKPVGLDSRHIECRNWRISL